MYIMLLQKSDFRNPRKFKNLCHKVGNPVSKLQGGICSCLPFWISVKTCPWMPLDGSWLCHSMLPPPPPPRRFTSCYAKAVVRCMERFIKHNVHKSKPRIIRIMDVVQDVGRCLRIRGGQYLWDVRSRGRVYFQFHSCWGRSFLERSNELCVLLWNNLPRVVGSEVIVVCYCSKLQFWSSE